MNCEKLGEYVQKEKWKPHKCYRKKYRESQITWKQDVINYHWLLMFLFTQLSSYDKDILLTSIQATSKSWAFGTGTAAIMLRPTRLCSWRAGRCVPSISGWTEKDRQSREFSCNPEQASRVLGVYWSTQHTWFWQNMLIVVWHESCLNHL